MASSIVDGFCRKEATTSHPALLPVHVSPVLTVGFLGTLLVWLGLVAGLAEGAYRLFQKLVLGSVILMPLDVIGTAPLVAMVWLVVPALLLLAAQRLLPSRVTYAGVIGVLAALAIFPLLLLATTMHKAIVGVLMVGIGLQVSRVVKQHPEGFRRLVHRTTIPLLILAILSWGTVGSIRGYQERRALAALPEPRAGLPNVLLIIWDTVRESSMSLYGYQRPTTPFLERFAPGGVRFDMAIATAPWTLPSHASMFTGQRPTATSARLNTPLDATHPVIAEAFARAGYATGGFIANMSYCSRDHGLGRGFIHYEDFRLTGGGMFNGSRLGQVLLRSMAFRHITGFYDLAGRKTAAQVNQGLLRWIDRRNDRPFFAFLNYFDAHQPYMAPQPFRSRFSFDSAAPFFPRTVDAAYDELTAEEIHWSMGEYDGGIAYQDSAVADLIAELERRGLLDNTVIVITSDHGEHFGEHRRISHGNSLYRQLLEVPLIIRFPGKVPAGGVVNTPVSLADLPQTLFYLAGLEDPVFPGASLHRFWRDSATTSEEVVLSEMPTLPNSRRAFSLIAGGYHYIRWFDRSPELYHLERDPHESNNLAGTIEAFPVMLRFAIIERAMKLNQVPRPSRPQRLTQ